MRALLYARNKYKLHRRQPLYKRQSLIRLLAFLALLAMIWLSFVPARASSFDHTQATVDTGCQRLTFSADGNPFPLCPGPFPTGGNCVWWGWEQWHLLGYDLPVNWGNAAEWAVDAERFGLSVGLSPRVGSLAVFPVADGVWAFGTAGHVAFVTSVDPDGQTFSVTYQNYGDTTPMFVGRGYNAPFINQPRFQRGQLRFIYFPKPIDPARFAKLPGIDGRGLAGLAFANASLNVGTNGTLAGSRVGLGLPPGSYDQEFSTDFSGNGFTDLLLYNRQSGRLDVLSLDYAYQKFLPRLVHNRPLPPESQQLPYRVSLSDAQTSVNGWGPDLDIHLGDFTGSGHTEILLYDRVSGQIQILTLTPQLTIATHVTLSGWGAGWEVYTGQFDGQHTNLLLYKRFAVPTPLPTNPTPIPSPTQPPTATPTHHPAPTPTVTPTATPTSVPSPTPTVTPTVTPTPTPTSVPSPTVTPTTTPSPTPTSTAAATGSSGSQLDSFQQNPSSAATPSGTGEPGDTSGQSPAEWATSGLSAEIRLVSFTKNGGVGVSQDYSLWHNSWEIYIGRFLSPTRDGVFLYDRTVGEARVVGFSAKLQLAQFRFLHNLGGNWDVHTGSFNGQIQAQILLYDPGTGDAQMLTLKKDLTVDKQITYASWGTDLVLYVGHFGLPTLSVMLYDPQLARSTFLAFDTSLNIVHQAIIQTWDQNSQILVGAFLDRSLCLTQHTCASGDDILVLNRTTGMVQQYVFSFGNLFNIYDNRIQAYLRDGMAMVASMFPVDASLFRLLSSEASTIHGEELY